MKFFVSVFLLFLSQHIFAQTTVDSSFVTYELETYQINLPSDWSIDDSGEGGVSFIIYAKPKRGNEKVLPNISATQKSLTSKVGSNFQSAEQYVKSYESLMSLANDNFKLLESKKTDNNSYTVIYTSTLEDTDGSKVNIKSHDTYFLKNKVVYLISYKAQIEDFDTELEKGKKVIYSFKFL